MPGGNIVPCGKTKLLIPCDVQPTHENVLTRTLTRAKEPWVLIVDHLTVQFFASGKCCCENH